MISLQQIADQLQISRVTVSKVVNNKPGVGLRTRKRILECLFNNGYTKIDSELFAEFGIVEQIRGKAALQTIAVVATEPHFARFWLRILNGISSTLSSQDHQLSYYFLTRDEEKSHKIPQSLLQGNTDGMIVLNVYDNETITELQKIAIPCVFLDASPQALRKNFQSDLLIIEGYRTIWQIAENLLQQGCRDIGFIGDIEYSESIRHRWAGFRDVMQHYSMALRREFCLLSEPLSHFYNQKNFNEAISAMPGLPRAFICANDFIAYMLLKYLRENNYSVPGDVLVSGFDNIGNSLDDSIPFSLTTVAVDAEYIGCRLAEQILLRLRRPSMRLETIHIEPNVIYGTSTQSF